MAWSRISRGRLPFDALTRRCTSFHAGPRGSRSRLYSRGAAIVEDKPGWHQRLDSANRKNARSTQTAREIVVLFHLRSVAVFVKYCAIWLGVTSFSPFTCLDNQPKNNGRNERRFLIVS